MVSAKFDVRRSDKDHFSLAFVTRVDFVGNPKRVRFHFSKSSTCRDEWVDFGSDRIAPVNTKSKDRAVVATKKSKKRKVVALVEASHMDSIDTHKTENSLSTFSNECDLTSGKEFAKNVKTKKRSKKGLTHIVDADEHAQSERRTGQKIKRAKSRIVPCVDVTSSCSQRAGGTTEQSTTYSSTNESESERRSQESMKGDVIKRTIKMKKKRKVTFRKPGSALDGKKFPKLASGQYEGESTSESQSVYINTTPIDEQCEMYAGVGGKPLSLDASLRNFFLTFFP
jgi:hypothetical protein